MLHGKMPTPTPLDMWGAGGESGCPVAGAVLRGVSCELLRWALMRPDDRPGPVRLIDQGPQQVPPVEDRLVAQALQIIWHHKESRGTVGGRGGTPTAAFSPVPGTPFPYRFGADHFSGDHRLPPGPGRAAAGRNPVVDQGSRFLGRFSRCGPHGQGLSPTEGPLATRIPEAVSEVAPPAVFAANRREVVAKKR